MADQKFPSASSPPPGPQPAPAGPRSGHDKVAQVFGELDQLPVEQTEGHWEDVHPDERERFVENIEEFYKAIIDRFHSGSETAARRFGELLNLA